MLPHPLGPLQRLAHPSPLPHHPPPRRPRPPPAPPHRLLLLPLQSTQGPTSVENVLGQDCGQGCVGDVEGVGVVGVDAVGVFGVCGWGGGGVWKFGDGWGCVVGVVLDGVVVVGVGVGAVMGDWD